MAAEGLWSSRLLGCSRAGERYRAGCGESHKWVVPSDSVPQFTPSSRKLSFAAFTRVEDRMIGLASAFFLFVVPTFLSSWIAERRGHAIKLWRWMGRGITYS